MKKLILLIIFGVVLSLNSFAGSIERIKFNMTFYQIPDINSTFDNATNSTANLVGSLGNTGAKYITTSNGENESLNFSGGDNDGLQFTKSSIFHLNTTNNLTYLFWTNISTSIRGTGRPTFYYANRYQPVSCDDNRPCTGHWALYGDIDSPEKVGGLYICNSLNTQNVQIEWNQAESFYAHAGWKMLTLRITHNGSANVEIFHNATLVANKSNSNTDCQTPQISNESLRIGAFEQASDASYIGGLKLISIINYSMSNSEIELYYNQTKDGSIFPSQSPPLPPIINLILNDSSLSLNDGVNVSTNVSDDVGLSFCRFIINQTGVNEFFNKSVGGTSDTCSQNYTIAILTGIVNFTVVVNDTSNNIVQQSEIVRIGDTTTPTIFGQSINGNSFTTSQRINVSVNCTDNYLVNYARVEWNRTGNYGNDTMTLLNPNHYSFNSLFIIGNYNITKFYCADTSINIANDTSNFTFSVTTVPSSSGGTSDSGGGGGGTRSIESAKSDCNIQFFPNQTTLSKNKVVSKLELINNEAFTLSPTFITNRSDLIEIKGELEKIIPQRTTITYSVVLYNISILSNNVNIKEDYIDSSIILKTTECKSISATVRIQRKFEVTSIILNIKKFLNEEIAPLKLTTKTSFSIKNYQILASLLLITTLSYSRVQNLSRTRKFILIIFTSSFVMTIVKIIIDLIK